MWSRTGWHCGPAVHVGVPGDADQGPFFPITLATLHPSLPPGSSPDLSAQSLLDIQARPQLPNSSSHHRSPLELTELRGDFCISSKLLVLHADCISSRCVLPGFPREGAAAPALLLPTWPYPGWVPTTVPLQEMARPCGGFFQTKSSFFK